MGWKETLQQARTLLEQGQLQEGVDSVMGAVEQHANTPERDAMLEEILSYVDHQVPRIGALFAIAGGALVEHGASPTALGRAILKPITRSLVLTERCLRLAEECEDEMAVEDGMEIGDAVLSDDAMRVLLSKDALAFDGFASMMTWFRPAVASWTRAPAVLQEVQKDDAYRAALESVGFACDGSRWLSILEEVPFNAPFVAWFPELEEMYSFTVDGCSDVAQVMILLSEALVEPLGRIGATVPAPKQIVDTSKGIGSQQINATYSANFQIYPWQALDLETNLPKDKTFTWRSPGGTGQHSLPPDFLPGKLATVDGVRPLLIVGPRLANVVQLTRVLPAVRIFGPLRASIHSTKRLDRPEVASWIEKIRSAKSALQQPAG